MSLNVSDVSLVMCFQRLEAVSRKLNFSDVSVTDTSPLSDVLDFDTSLIVNEVS